MKIKQLFVLITIFICGVLDAQVLKVKQVFQEKTNWCWSGVSECILDYYYHPNHQCEIAEYARNRSTLNSYGLLNCCSGISSTCNYPNYAWGTDGSIQDILKHFGDIKNDGISRALTKEEIINEISNCRPFIISFAWFSGGGHVMVGYGFNDGYVNYMDPWKGQGYKVSNYDWMKKNKDHSWDGTNVLKTDPKLPQSATKPVGRSIFTQNPENATYTTSSINGASEYFWTIFPNNAGVITGNDTSIIVDYNDNFIGKVYLKVEGRNDCILSKSDSLNISVNPIAPNIIEENSLLKSSNSEGNQWYWEDTPIALANKQTFKPKKNGRYKCVATINTCSSQPSNTISVESINSNTFADLSPLSVYPSPASDKIRISITEPFNEIYTVDIFDISGNQIYNQVTDKNIDEIEIDITAYLKGIYLLHVYNNEKSLTAKIIKD